MANELDEVTAVPREEGRDVNVIDKQLETKGYKSALVLEIILFILGIIPGLIFVLCKIHAGKYLSQLQQRIQHDASQIDNYLEQRVVILENMAALVNKATKLDEETFKAIAQARAGGQSLNEKAAALENVNSKINVAMEAYPELKAHQEIAMAMQQNSYLQKEITAAREVYNDTVLEWNGLIFRWPTYMIVAARKGYTTRIPFSVGAETKQRAREVFF